MTQRQRRRGRRFGGFAVEVGGGWAVAVAVGGGLGFGAVVVGLGCGLGCGLGGGGAAAVVGGGGGVAAVAVGTWGATWTGGGADSIARVGSLFGSRCKKSQAATPAVTSSIPANSAITMNANRPLRPELGGCGEYPGAMVGAAPKAGAGAAYGCAGAAGGAGT